MLELQILLSHISGQLQNMEQLRPVLLLKRLTYTDLEQRETVIVVLDELEQVAGDHGHVLLLDGFHPLMEHVLEVVDALASRE